ncbi:MAG: respiratory nitrate reductase chaperone NarJ [Dehalococcoidia bacterium]|nr:respiratory nitrate reductase chaperone NarJ [Dehalococcoidia bacterium]
MGEQTVERRMFRLFADILSYPSVDLLERAGECEALVSTINPSVASLVGNFRAFVEVASQGHLEELYTATFDLDAAYHPYLGYHLFGESYERSAFLLELKERYRAQGYIADEKELPDRLSVVLAFLSVSADAGLNQEIVQEGLLPALEKMMKRSQEAGDEPADEPPDDIHLYQSLLLALQMLLPEFQPASVPEEEALSTGGRADD